MTEETESVLAVLGFVAAVFITVILGVVGHTWEGLERFRLAFTILAAGTGLAWLALVAGVRFVRQPKRPHRGPETNTLGDEPPALANFLVGGFRVGPEAVTATFLDLAARGYVGIDSHPNGTHEARMLKGDFAGLTAYEQAVLLLLRQKLLGDIVPAPALTTGPPTWASLWRRSFRRSVENDAKARGLSEDLWDRRTIARLGLAGAVPVLLTALASAEAALGFLAAIAVAVILGALMGTGRQRHTEAGLERAGTWLGVARYLKADVGFRDLPPAAVIVWDRYLAYAAAFGVARGALRAFRFGADVEGRGSLAASPA